MFSEAIKPYSDTKNPHFNAIQRNNRLGNLAKAVTIGGALITIGGLSVLAYLYFTGGAGLSFPIAGYTLHASMMPLLYGTMGAAGITVAGGLWATGHAVAKKRAKANYDEAQNKCGFEQKKKEAQEIAKRTVESRTLKGLIEFALSLESKYSTLPREEEDKELLAIQLRVVADKLDEVEKEQKGTTSQSNVLRFMISKLEAKTQST